MPEGKAGTPAASYERTRREQESQKDREARLDRQRLRTNHLTPGQRWGWVPLLVITKPVQSPGINNFLLWLSEVLQQSFPNIGPQLQALLR